MVLTGVAMGRVFSGAEADLVMEYWSLPDVTVKGNRMLTGRGTAERVYSESFVAAS